MVPSVHFDKGSIFVVGAAHAGKSELSMRMILKVQEELGGDGLSKRGGVTKLAGSQFRTVVIGTALPEEQAFKSRLDGLKSLRPSSWRTIEEPVALVNSLETMKDEYDYFLIDSLSQWIAALLYTGSSKYSLEQLEVYAMDEIKGFIELLQKMKKDCTKNLIVVSSEVGAGISPQKHIERLFRELVGRANCMVAEVAGTVVHVVAGIGTVIKS